MGRKTKIVFINGILLTLMVAFNNCGQPGEIRFGKSASQQAGNQPVTQPDTQPDNDGTSVNPPEAGVPSTPTTPVDPTTPVITKPELRKIEKFITLSETQQADILFVVDNSASMYDEQLNMSTRFPGFIQNLKQINWRVGIITTDVDDPTLSYSDGRLQAFDNGQSYIDAKIPALDAQNMFSKTIQRSEAGSPSEMGIYATYRFLERQSATKDSFLRPDSSLNVVIVSDADETPYTYTKRNSPEELIKFLKKTWPMKKFQAHAIVVQDGDAGCLKVSDNEDYGLSYLNLAELTGGVKGDVCAADYGSQLKFLSEKIKELVSTIVLECEPVADVESKEPMLSIKVDGQPPVEIEKIVGKDVFIKGNLPTGYIKLEYYCLK